MLPVSCYRSTQKTTCGLTLIEVLIALAIIGIALTAIIKAASQNIRATNHLQEKTIATWVAEDIINEVRAGIIKLPPAPDKLSQSTTMLGQEWYWQASQEETPNTHIAKITVSVSANEKDKDDSMAIINLESYLYHAE